MKTLFNKIIGSTKSYKTGIGRVYPTNFMFRPGHVGNRKPGKF